jgi:hypothetical protein
MKYYEGFRRSGKSFAEMVGKPDEFRDAIGRITLSFSFLEEMARNIILCLCNSNGDIGGIMTAELSFRKKTDALGSLARYHVSKLPQDTNSTRIGEQLAELITLCQKSEELRNTYLHSSYGMKSVRTKITSKAKHGLRTTVERVDSALLLDIADFIFETGAELRGIPLILGLADVMYENGDGITYEKSGRVIASYDYGK